MRFVERMPWWTGWALGAVGLGLQIAGGSEWGILLGIPLFVATSYFALRVRALRRRRLR